MALPDGGVYCVAKAAKNGHIVQATAHLPYSIDLSKVRAEIAVKYIAVSPTWYALNNLTLQIADISKSEDEENILFRFTNLVNHNPDDVYTNMRKQLSDTFTSTTPLIKILKPRNQKTPVIRLRKNAVVEFSEQMQDLLGIEKMYNSSESKDLDIDFTCRKNINTSTTDIYYLKSEEISSNFMLDNKLDRIIELLHIPGTETLAFSPSQLTYTRLEARLLERLTFTLYNEQDEIVTSDHSDLYIVCHLRPSYAQIR